MQLFGFNHSKCKTQCRLGVGRIRLMRNKKTLAVKQLRKEVSELLRQDKQGNARIRVESVMREERMLKAFEVLELYLELLAVRAELLAKTKEIPSDMVEAICSVIYAGERVSTDLAEVNAVAKQLVAKYSGVYKESGFPHEVSSDLTCRKWQVNDNLIDYLAISAPIPAEKLATLEGIAAEFNVPFDKEKAALEMLPGGGRPAPVAAYPVETLAAGAPMLQQLPPPLAQDFVPPPAGAPPAEAQRQPAVETWRPVGMPAPKGAAPAPAASPAQQHVADVLAGGTVVVRPGIGASPATAPPPAAKDHSGWVAPKQEDENRQGRAFQSHVGAAAAWRQTRLGLSPRGSGGEELQQPVQPPAAQFPAPAPIPPSSSMDQLPSGTAQSSGGSTPSVGERPATPSGSYADASAAADAAKRYSHMAQQAAQRAEEFAATQSAGSPAAVAAAPAGGNTPGADAGSGSGGNISPGGGRLVPRTGSEVQRSYDAAPGPPSKAQAIAPGPPLAPPAAADASASGASSAAAADATGEDGEVDVSGLPSVPQAPAAAAAGEPAAQDELDELTRRFEQLKRR